MKKVLVVVDMQNDFIDGALGTKEAVSILPNVKENKGIQRCRPYGYIYKRYHDKTIFKLKKAKLAG